jgi:hypothetical protein
MAWRDQSGKACGEVGQQEQRNVALDLKAEADSTCAAWSPTPCSSRTSDRAPRRLGLGPDVLHAQPVAGDHQGDRLRSDRPVPESAGVPTIAESCQAWRRSRGAHSQPLLPAIATDEVTGVVAAFATVAGSGIGQVVVSLLEACSN